MPKSPQIPASSTKPPDLSDGYWSGLSPFSQAVYLRVRPQRKATYTTDVRLGHLESFLQGQEADMRLMGGTLELTPDFQRGHVWTLSQRVRYVESLLRGTAPTRLQFNCPGWSREADACGDIRSHTFQCIDGLQRLTSVRQFLANEFAVFDDLGVNDFKDTSFHLKSYTMQIAVYEFATRAELLQHYLDVNSAGVVHSEAELERVRGLLAAARGA